MRRTGECGADGADADAKPKLEPEPEPELGARARLSGARGEATDVVSASAAYGAGGVGPSDATRTAVITRSLACPM